MDYEHLTRDELITLIRALAAKRPGRETHDPNTGFLTLGVREEQEFERSPYPIRIFDRESLQYLVVNDAALKLYGYTREEFLKLTLFDTRHPDGPAAGGRSGTAAQGRGTFCLRVPFPGQVR